MPPVEDCTKQDYTVLIVIGVAWKTEYRWCADSLRGSFIMTPGTFYPSEATRCILRHGLIRQRIRHRRGLVRRKRSVRFAMLPSAKYRVSTTNEPLTPVLASHPRFAFSPSGITQ
ncbi:hypothetical protein COMA2_120074 [Candidatus Nitrospira nitrificans]|uniref:Uncharacterized protein n=1 Tax=Candidatus Nitrospira nitrificans TaxID=1742973 RepID=A0A0S4LBA3_9BACT|nr:hypothetical protein COMA2_120074 [Candidatus Nitrospira nitrificans]